MVVALEFPKIAVVVPVIEGSQVDRIDKGIAPDFDGGINHVFATIP